MTHHQSALTTLIGEVLADPDLAHSDVFRRMLQAGLQDLINAEATVKIGAAPHERTPERTTRRNGTRPKTLATPAGEVDLQIPKLREGSFFPSLLSPRRRVDKALYAVICQAWIDGVSTRKVDQLVRALGNDTGISRSTVSRICGEIDEAVQEFLHRRIDHTWFPYLFLDATYLDVRHRGRVVSQALVVATGLSGDRRREVLWRARGRAGPRSPGGPQSPWWTSAPGAPSASEKTSTPAATMASVGFFMVESPLRGVASGCAGQARDRDRMAWPGTVAPPGPGDRAVRGPRLNGISRRCRTRRSLHPRNRRSAAGPPGPGAGAARPRRTPSSPALCGGPSPMAARRPV